MLTLWGLCTMSTSERWQRRAMETHNDVGGSQKHHAEYGERGLTVPSYTVLLLQQSQKGSYRNGQQTQGAWERDPAGADYEGTVPGMGGEEVF